MIRHVLLATFFVGLGLGLVVLICTRYDPRPETIRRFAIGGAISIGLVAMLSAFSVTRSAACPDNPIETCHYNDSTPAMAGVVAVYLVVCAIRSRIIYFER